MTKTEWLEELRGAIRYKDFTDDQWECCQMIFDLVGGEHHLYGKIKPYAHGIEYNPSGHNLATYDFNTLTTMVFLAHDRMIRVEIVSSGPGMVRWCFWKRHSRDGEHYDRHPTLYQAIEVHRSNFPKEGEPS